MINSTFALGLRAVSISQIQHQQLLISLHMLENESATLDTNSQPMDFIAHFLHHLYTSQNSSVRASILRIITNLEINSNKSIVEKYQFDKIVAASLDQKIPDPPVKIDEEKLAAFKVIMVGLKYFSVLPLSIIRALISLYNAPKHNYHKLIVSILAEGILVYDDFPDLEEVSSIFIDKVMENQDQSLIGLFGYIFERQSHRAIQKHFATRLNSPFSAMGDTKDLTVATIVITQILRSWPGLMCFGIQIGALPDLLRIINHSTPIVLKILNDLLFIDGPDQSVVDCYTGFLFYYLLKNGILEKLSEISKNNEDAVNLLNLLLRYAPPDSTLCKSIYHPKARIDYTESENIYLKVSQNIANVVIPTTISNYTLPREPTQWDWATIRSYLMVLLPSNSTEAASPNAQTFYNRLFDYFCLEFNTSYSSTNYAVISQCLFAFINLLLATKRGQDLLSEKLNFAQAIVNAYNNLRNATTIEKNHPSWVLIEIFCHLMCETEGMQALVRWRIFHVLDREADKFKTPQVFQKLLRKLSFTPQYQLTATFYVRFLKSENLEIVEIAMHELKKKADKLPNFYKDCLKMILLDQIKETYQKIKKSNDELNAMTNVQAQSPNTDALIKSLQNMKSQMNLYLNLLCEMMMKSNECLEIVAKDKLLHQIIKLFSREIYCVLLSHPEGLLNANVDEEISYWKTQGIFQYVHTYDMAVSMTFNKKFMTIPSIVHSENYALMPPHLFGQLSKTVEGYNKLKPLIGYLLKLCISSTILKRRAAFFALGHLGSIPNGISIDILVKMIESAEESSSYLLRGTLFVALSLVYLTPQFSDFLFTAGFHLFRFGSHTCVIPIDPKLILIDTASNDEKVSENIEPKTSFNQLTELVIKMMNPIISGQARNDLVALVNTHGKEMSTYENVSFLHNTLAKYSFGTEARQFLYSLFKFVPIIPPSYPVIDTRIASECCARVLESTAYTTNMLPSENTTLSYIKIPSFPAAMIKQQRPTTKVPEVYLSDAEFQNVTGYDRISFYRLNEQQKLAIRNNIMK
ncbi:hypothetical protein TRFO_10654 [Tritrichomonas foetus]|uniref:Uncharacterized protein n=1 Tax=Tritrichomonas foetus TaxID=1144522 RepID=A0A1J4JAB0_9EUKA|nr:hypothetical protein TRFO_10654 [Tritrichomonas foetus]|eukprot:OHS95167.1 hypothetical protein TRFO_10654 [Tritrichomonas foetus]